VNRSGSPRLDSVAPPFCASFVCATTFSYPLDHPLRFPRRQLPSLFSTLSPPSASLTPRKLSCSLHNTAIRPQRRRAKTPGCVRPHLRCARPTAISILPDHGRSTNAAIRHGKLWRRRERGVCHSQR